MLRNRFFKQLLGSCLDLAPILVVVLVFQILVIQQPITDISRLLSGTLFIILGLTLFIQGLEQGLFPVGETMAYAFARKGSLFCLLLFAFCLGFGTTIAEPALIAVADEAAHVASEGQLIATSKAAQIEYALGLRLTVAVAVGIAILIGVLRILRDWPLQYLIISGYILVLVLTPFAPAEIIGIAYDSGGVTTSTITVPLVTALGIGLSTTIKGRNPIIDGFGLIALASLLPIILVMIYGMLI